MKKPVLFINLILMAVIAAGNYLFLSVGGSQYKYFCSVLFALQGFVNLLYAFRQPRTNRRFCVAMSVGLVFAMLGDILLGSSFVLGAGLFATGHLCYLLGFSFLRAIGKRDLLISAVLFAAAGCFVMFCPLLTFDNALMQWVCLVYALIISLMTGKALGSLITERNSLTILLALGAALFFFSDLMLVLDWFMGLGRTAGNLCMATYYPAECLLAYSIYHSTGKES